MKRVILLILFFFTTHAFGNDSLFEFKVIDGGCDAPEETTSIKSNIEDGYLVTTVNVATNCASIPHLPSYKISEIGDEIILEFETFSPSGAQAKCMCNNTVIFKLPTVSERYAGEFKISSETKVKVTMDNKEIIP